VHLTALPKPPIPRHESGRVEPYCKPAAFKPAAQELAVPHLKGAAPDMRDRFAGRGSKATGKRAEQCPLVRFLRTGPRKIAKTCMPTPYFISASKNAKGPQFAGPCYMGQSVIFFAAFGQVAVGCPWRRLRFRVLPFGWALAGRGANGRGAWACFFSGCLDKGCLFRVRFSAILAGARRCSGTGAAFCRFSVSGFFT